jgi:hypothetical protein
MTPIIPATVSPLCGLAHPIRCAVVLLLACTFVPSPSAAQTPASGGIAPPPRPERPYRGLFGGGVGETAQSLTLDGAFGVGTGGTHPSMASGPAESLALQGTGNLTTSANLNYSLSRDKFAVFGSNALLADYYRHPSGNKILPRDVATAGVSLSIGKTGVGIGMTYKNVPELSASDFFDGEPAKVIPLNQNVPLTFERYSRFGYTLDVSQPLTRRLQMGAGVYYARGMIESRAWTIFTYSGAASYSIGKGLGAYMEYKDGGQRDQTPGAPSTLDRHPRTSFGIDYSKPLSFSRRTTLSFTTGTAGMHDRNLDEMQYQLVGSVTLNREIGRTWLASVSYARDLRHIESLGEPLLSNSVNLGLQGSISHRVQFGTWFGGSSGQLGSSSETVSHTDAYFGSAQASVALTRLLGLTVDYAYYDYALPSHDLLGDAAGSAGKYQVVRAYLQVWLPLITQRKR